MKYHYQDLNDYIPKRYWKHARCWINEFNFEWVIPSKDVGFKIGLADYDESALSFNMHLYLISLYGSWNNFKAQQFISDLVKRKGQKYGNGRKIGISFHDGCIFVDIWGCPMEWRSEDPKWWSFSINLTDLILGKKKYSSEDLETRDVQVPMPEGNYEATATLRLDTWKRPRWFANQVKRVNIDIKKMIPFQGKGTTPYNCGIDGTTGTTLPANSIAEGVGALVGSVLKNRVKNGGWGDWNFTKEVA